MSDDWDGFCRDLDDLFRDIPDPTDDELRAIEADPIHILTDDEFYEWRDAMLEER